MVKLFAYLTFLVVQDAAITIIGSWCNVGFKAFYAFPKYKSCHCGQTDKLLTSPNGQVFLPVIICFGILNFARKKDQS